MLDFRNGNYIIRNHLTTLYYIYFQCVNVLTSFLNVDVLYVL